MSNCLANGREVKDRASGGTARQLSIIEHSFSNETRELHKD